MNTKKKSTQGNPQNKNKGDFLVRRVQPTFPHGATSNVAGPNLILEFVGANVAPDRREVFSAIILNKKIAIDIKKRLDEYLEYLKDYKEDDIDV
ncbi:hypothetical protein [Pantoea sp. EEL5]|uniref:hypothetical protein n=1 Tax=Pantoea sp. EEL5 TaxID=3416806 RepID=UPI003CE94534